MYVCTNDLSTKHAPTSILDKIEWDSETYDTAVGCQDGGNLQAEARFKAQYPPVPNSICDPATIEDGRGTAVAYYLPQALSEERQVSRNQHHSHSMHADF